MENIKDNSKETAEINGEELEKVAGGGAPIVSPVQKLLYRYMCDGLKGCGKDFTAEVGTKCCPYCGSTNIHQVAAIMA